MIANSLSRQEWACRLTAAWKRNTELRAEVVRDTVAFGSLLQQAKADLREKRGYGEWGKMFERYEVPFDQDTAAQLMAIARDPVVGDSEHARNLPGSRYALYLLTKIPKTLLKQMITDGRVHADLERKDVEALLANLKPARPGGLDEQLVSNLKTIEPALAENQLIPLLTHFWFTGQQLMAFNDQIAIAVPFASDFKGAVSAKTLRLLQLGFDGEINMRSADGTLAIQDASGRVRIGLPMLELEPRLLLEIPERPRFHSDARAVAQLVEAVQYCLPSIGYDTSAAENLGVTLEPLDGQIAVFATNSFTIRQAKVPAGLRLRERVILPLAFCTQLVRLYAGLSEQEKTAVSFVVGRDRGRHPYALFRAGDTKLYSRLLKTRSPLDFADILHHHLPRNLALVEVPARFFRAVERAVIVCSEQRRNTTLTVANGRITFFSQSAAEEVTEVLPIAESHAAISVRVEAEHLRAAAGFNQIQVAPLCVVFGQADHPARRLLVSCEREERHERSDVTRVSD